MEGIQLKPIDDADKGEFIIGFNCAGKEQILIGSCCYNRDDGWHPIYSSVTSEITHFIPMPKLPAPPKKPLTSRQIADAFLFIKPILIGSGAIVKIRSIWRDRSDLRFDYENHPGSAIIAYPVDGVTYE